MAYYIVEGSVMKAKPKNFIPRPEGVGHIGYHPVVVLSQPDSQGFVFVTPMSHNHPDGTPTREASRYGLPVDPIKGESRVSVGKPKVIHMENLKSNEPPMVMRCEYYAALKSEICQYEAMRRGY